MSIQANRTDEEASFPYLREASIRHHGFRERGPVPYAGRRRRGISGYTRNGTEKG